MDKELIDIAWRCLPRDFRVERAFALEMGVKVKFEDNFFM